MCRETTLVPIIALAVFIVSLGSSAFGQNVSRPASQTTVRESPDRMSKDGVGGRSTERFEAQMPAQQQEINEVRARLQKLEAMLEALAVGAGCRFGMCVAARPRIPYRSDNQ